MLVKVNKKEQGEMGKKKVYPSGFSREIEPIEYKKIFMMRN